MNYSTIAADLGHYLTSLLTKIDNIETEMMDKKSRGTTHALSFVDQTQMIAVICTRVESDPGIEEHRKKAFLSKVEVVKRRIAKNILGIDISALDKKKVPYYSVCLRFKDPMQPTEYVSARFVYEEETGSLVLGLLPGLTRYIPMSNLREYIVEKVDV